MKRITDITESPCYNCEVKNNCLERCNRSIELDNIKISICYNAEYERKNCPIYIAETAFIVEEDYD